MTLIQEIESIPTALSCTHSLCPNLIGFHKYDIIIWHRASQSMVPWICQHLNVDRFVVSHTLLVHRIIQRSNFEKSVSFVQAFIIRKMKKLLDFFKFIIDYQRRDHSVLVVLPPPPIHFLSWQLIITSQYKDGNK